MKNNEIKFETISELINFLNDNELAELDRLIKKAAEAKKSLYRYANDLIDKLDRGEPVGYYYVLNGPKNLSSEKEDRISYYAKDKLYPILKNHSFSSDEIEKLCSNNYRSVFGISFPLLMSDDKYVSDHEKAKRYYRECIVINGNKYHMCSQWQKNRRSILKELIDEFCDNPSKKLL